MMKRLFFFRSSGGNNNQTSPTSADKKTHCEKTGERVERSRVTKHSSDQEVFDSAPCLRRSLSFSSGSVHETGKKLRDHVEKIGSPCSTNYISREQSNYHSARSRTLTPERKNRAKCSSTRREEKVDSIPPRVYSDLSDTSYCSSNISNKVLDRYIDGEQQIGNNELKADFSVNNQYNRGNTAVKLLPRFRDARKHKPKSQSFRETNSSQLNLSCRTSCGDGFDPKSPRKLATEVERLPYPQEFHADSPITIEDIYNRNLTMFSTAYADERAEEDCLADWNGETDGSHHVKSLEFPERHALPGNKLQVRENTDALSETDLELFKKFKEAEDRVALLSEELERENFLEVRGVSMPILIQILRRLTEEKVNMAMEVSSVLQDRIAEKSFYREELKLVSAGLDSQTRRLEKEKNELQFALEKELDRRSIDWSLKLEKYQAEEHRLRERVRELAEQNVSLQREVSSFSERETDTRAKIITSDKEIVDLSTQLKEAKEDNHLLLKNLSEMIEKSRAAEEDQNCTRRNYAEKVTECRDLHQVITRLQRSCTNQEKTIDGLRGFCEELRKKISEENYNLDMERLQIEQMRLTGVEHELRKEVESSRVENNSLRSENINLLNRLKKNGSEGTFSTFNLDIELQNRVDCLQDQVLLSLTESSQFCRKLLEKMKLNAGSMLKNGSNIAMGQDGQILEYEVKIQHLERSAGNLASSLRTISSVLHEKSTMLLEKYPMAKESQSPNLDDVSPKRKDAKLKDLILSELKAEALMTSLLREKLYSKELAIEQLQSELAAAVRGNDILKSEVQHAMDNFSCVNHKTKDLELQMMKKDEIINRLEGDLQACKKELTIVKGILPKVSEERDLMWKEVKQYSESNMLLNTEINVMRKKIEALDEDILLKEGQITILKDSIGKPFELIAGLDSATNFRWKDSS